MLWNARRKRRPTPRDLEAAQKGEAESTSSPWSWHTRAVVGVAKRVQPDAARCMDMVNMVRGGKRINCDARAWRPRQERENATLAEADVGAVHHLPRVRARGAVVARAAARRPRVGRARNSSVCAPDTTHPAPTCEGSRQNCSARSSAPPSSGAAPERSATVPHCCSAVSGRA